MYSSSRCYWFPKRHWTKVLAVSERALVLKVLPGRGGGESSDQKVLKEYKVIQVLNEITLTPQGAQGATTAAQGDTGHHKEQKVLLLLKEPHELRVHISARCTVGAVHGSVHAQLCRLPWTCSLLSSMGWH